MIVNQDDRKYYVKDGMYTEIPDVRNKAFFKGKLFNFSDSIDDFLKSSNESCIVPVYCDSIDQKSRGYRTVLLLTKSELVKFSTSEQGQYARYFNNIKNVEEKHAYFIYLEKFARARNDCLIKAVMKLEKNEVEDRACASFIGDDIESMIEQMDKILSHG